MAVKSHLEELKKSGTRANHNGDQFNERFALELASRKFIASFTKEDFEFFQRFNALRYLFHK